MKEIIIDKTNYGKRMDKFVLALLPEATKSFCYKMFRKKNIVLNDKKVTGSEVLSIGDVIKVYFSDETFDKFAGSVGGKDLGNDFVFSLPQVVFEDENILVLNKAKGIFSQPKEGKISIIDQIYSHYKNTDLETAKGFKIGTCNRLDTDTTGIIISGKTVRATSDVNRLIKEHRVKKTYLAIVKGRISKEILLKNKIEKLDGIARVSADGRSAEMRVTPIKASDDFSFVEVELKSGRYHQIRVSLADIGHPIIGDKKYGVRKLNEFYKKKFGINSQLLHSYSYEFLDRVAGKKYDIFKTEIPREFEEIVNGIL